MTTTAFVGLGANYGRPRETLPLSVRALAALPRTRLDGVSRLYLTRPVGVVAQPDFLNAVVALSVPDAGDPETGALSLLEALKQLEASLGRQPRERWGPREMDLDLLLFGDHELRTARADGRWLTVPHPELAQRLFVLAPLADIAPDLRPPGWETSVSEMASRRRTVEGEQAVRVAGAWDPAAQDWMS